MGKITSVTVQRICFFDPVGMLPAQDSAVLHQADRAARRRRPAAKPEKEKLVAWLEVLHQEPIGVADVARQAKAERASPDSFPMVGAHSLVVEHQLFVTSRVRRGDR